MVQQIRSVNTNQLDRAFAENNRQHAIFRRRQDERERIARARRKASRQRRTAALLTVLGGAAGAGLAAGTSANQGQQAFSGETIGGPDSPQLTMGESSGITPIESASGPDARARFTGALRGARFGASLAEAFGPDPGRNQGISQFLNTAASLEGVGPDEEKQANAAINQLLIDRSRQGFQSQLTDPANDVGPFASDLSGTPEQQRAANTVRGIDQLGRQNLGSVDPRVLSGVLSQFNPERNIELVKTPRGTFAVDKSALQGGEVFGGGQARPGKQFNVVGPGNTIIASGVSRPEAKTVQANNPGSQLTQVGTTPITPGGTGGGSKRLVDVVAKDGTVIDTGLAPKAANQVKKENPGSRVVNTPTRRQAGPTPQGQKARLSRTLERALRFTKGIEGKDELISLVLESGSGIPDFSKLNKVDAEEVEKNYLRFLKLDLRENIPSVEKDIIRGEIKRVEKDIIRGEIKRVETEFDLIRSGRAALAAGKSRAAVEQRLSENNIDPSRL